MRKKEDKSLYDLCVNVRGTRKGKGTYRLDETRIAALDAIGFEWEAGASSTTASRDDVFFARVDKLKAYKEKHGHFNVRWKDDSNLYNYCNNLRQAR